MYLREALKAALRDRGDHLHDARESPRIVGLLRGPWGEYFKDEVLARELELDGGGLDSVQVDGEEMWVGMEPLGKAGSG